ncbi:MAG: hypothetical protein ACYTF1_25875 [Planctomycetota bacterium]|jgi:hypothetical protein
MARRLIPYPEYKRGQLYDPFKLAGRGYGQPRGGLPTAKERGFLTGAGEQLGKEFSWLYGGRPLTEQEMQPLMARGGRDPRFGTIGGLNIGVGGGVQTPSLPQSPMGGLPGAGATAYKAPTGFGPQVKTPGGEGTQPMFPYQEVGPTPAAMKDVSALSQLPYPVGVFMALRG